jgi:hypothetical protein
MRRSRGVVYYYRGAYRCFGYGLPEEEESVEMSADEQDEVRALFGLKPKEDRDEEDHCGDPR